MVGMGTIVNAIAVISGGIIGLIFKKGLAERYRDIVLKSNGLAVMFLGISGAMSRMLVIQDSALETQGAIMVILTITLGALIGEWINLDGHLETFGAWLRRKAGSESDSKFIEGFVVSSLTICIGAMAVVGALQDGLTGNGELLYMKSVIDFIVVAAFAAAYGKGPIFAVIPIVLLQGSVTALAGLLAPVLTEVAIDNLSMIGSVLITGVGINLVFPVKIKVANLLPSLVLVVLYSIFFIK